MRKTSSYVLALLIAVAGASALGTVAYAAPEDSFEQQAQKAVKGQITDANTGEPVIGASVVQKGTTNGVITDIDGNFQISVPEGAVLEVSSIGYQTVEVTAQAVLNIKLTEDVLMLEETIVVGYGTARKKDVSGSVTHADLSALKDSPNVNVMSGLQGVVPGLNVGATTQAGSDPSITVRGTNSISGSQTPLIVLDGIIYRGTLVDINPADIESIDVLKDASAAAIYGSQAANGVMLITSKQVKGESKPIIEYSGSFAFQGSANGKMHLMDRAEWLDLVSEVMYENSHLTSDLSQKNPDFNVGNYMPCPASANGYIAGCDTDWWGLFTNAHPYIQNHNVSIRGRSERSSYYMSFGFTDQKNLVKTDNYKRYNFRVNLETRITDWLKVGTQTFFTVSDRSGAILGPVWSLPPVCNPYNEDGTYQKYPYKSTLNPYLELEQDNVNTRTPLVANFYVDANIPFIKGLNYRLNLSETYTTSRQATFNPYGASENGSASKYHTVQHDWTVDNILSYKRGFGEHFIDATLVYGAEKRHYDNTTASASYFDNMILGFNKLDAAQVDMQRAASSGWEEQSIYSMGRINYTFKDRYILTATVRRDGFSGFGSANKFATFPSVAAAWRISEENFMKDVNWIDELKLRLSWGKNGNRTVGRYSTLATVGYNNAAIYGDDMSAAEKGVYLGSLGNDTLKWESTSTFNFGLDFNFLKGRLYGALDAYYSHTYDMLYNINIPRMNNGQSSVATNIGQMDNRGVELTVTGVPIKNKDWSWDVTFNFSLNRNKIVSILGPDNDLDGDGKEDDIINSSIFIGKPYNAIYTYVQDTENPMWQLGDDIPTGFSFGSYRFVDLDGDGQITSGADRQIIGYSDPGYRFSIQNTLRYRNWDLKVFINSIQGGKNYYLANAGSGLSNPDNIKQQNNYTWDYWTPENPDAKYRRPGYYSSVCGNGWHPYTSRGFVRLQDITLGYTVPAKALQKAKIQGVRVFLTGKNLVTLTKWDGWDPETGAGLGGTYPLLKSYSLGVNFSF